MLGGALGESNGAKGGVKLDVPGPRSLLQPIESLAQPQHLVLLAAAAATWRLFDVDHLSELPIEKCGLHVHVMDVAVLRCHGRQIRCPPSA